MAEYIESICRRCFHSYVCEQFNEHRDSNNQKCHFSNDHFVPIADVAPVVHGRWEIKTDDYDCEYAKCSVCGEEFYDANEDTIDITFNYCPNCGARMKDGDGNG